MKQLILSNSTRASHSTISIRQAARGIVALSPIELPVMQEPSPAAAPKPVGMSLPMA